MHATPAKVGLENCGVVTPGRDREVLNSTANQNGVSGMARFAQQTAVSPDRSRSEIEQTLLRYGAEQFLYGWSGNAAMIGFSYKGRTVKFRLPLPARDDPKFTETPARGRRRSNETQIALWEQACRQSWRALCLVIKAKLEAVESGITTFEDEFLAHFVLPNGQSVGGYILPKLQLAYANRNVALLPNESEFAGSVKK